MRVLALGLVSSALVMVSVGASAQVAIEHEDVACIVVGQFPVLDACFRPGPDLARARVYFRPEGTPSWYYVEASAPAPPKVGDPAELLCRKATLPKPKKFLLEKHVEYYVEATGKRMESSQTATYRPLVVKNEGECKKKVVAPFVPNATVQVFPAMPAAFAAGGGLSGAAVAAVVGAGVAGGTGAVIAATSGGGSGPATTNPPVTTVAPATVPTTTTTTTLPPPVAFNPVFKVFKAGVLQPDKIVGTEPLQLQFFMCESSGPLPLKYNVLVNGGIVTAGCDSTITFTTAGYTPGFGGVAARGLPPPPPPSASYAVVMRMQSDGPGNDPKDTRALTVDVSAAGCPVPTIALASPTAGQRFEILPFTINFSSTASADVTSVDYFIDFPSRPGYAAGSSTTPPGFAASVDSTRLRNDGVLGCPTTVQAWALARTGCRAGVASAKVPIVVGDAGCLAAAADGGTDGARDAQPAWTSDLTVPGGRGQVVMNGGDAMFPAAGGRVILTGRPRSGENRVEATLVQAAGQPGLWRFELGAEPSLASGSLRVIAGDVTLITPDTVVFRMKGRPGERVVFTFRAGR